MGGAPTKTKPQTLGQNWYNKNTMKFDEAKSVIWYKKKLYGLELIDNSHYIID